MIVGLKSRGLGCSLFDIECLVTAMETGIPLVTDDGDLLSIFGIEPETYR